MLTWEPLAKSTRHGLRQATKPVNFCNVGVDFKHFAFDLGHFGVDFEHVGVDSWTPLLSQRRMGPARERNPSALLVEERAEPQAFVSHVYQWPFACRSYDGILRITVV